LLNARTGETLFATSETGNEANLLTSFPARAKLRGRLGIRRVTQAEAVEVALVLPSSSDAARHYAEGLSNLRVFNALDAQSELAKRCDGTNFALAHSSLATVGRNLATTKMQSGKQKVFDLSSNLPLRTVARGGPLPGTLS